MRPSNDADHPRDDILDTARRQAGPTPPSVCCVIVTYRPEHEPLLRQVEVIHPQVDRIFVIDNGNGSDLPDLSSQPGLEVIHLGDNFGIAHAQNAGIRRSRENGATHVLLLDQDSLPADDMVIRLLEGLANLQDAGIAVAAVGPQYCDERQGSVSPFVYRDGLVLRERPVSARQPAVVPADFLIASGCLIPVAALDAVGGMEETFFIDYVDIEWGLRAQNLGLAIYGIPAAHMTHNLGDDWIVYRGRRFPVYSSLRQYYYARNSILLARRRWIGWPWRFILTRRAVKQLLAFSILLPGPRLEIFRMMTLGIWHGVIGRDGKK